jgi:flagellin-like protein
LIHPAKARKRLGRVLRGEKGITGLETAIILIAFIVVASVFAYTVLVGGIYASQKSKQSIQEGIDSISTLRVQGEPTAYSNEYDLDNNNGNDNDICTCESNWTGDVTDATGTPSLDSDTSKEGSYSVGIVCAGTYNGSGNDLLASKAASVNNLSTAASVRLWIKTSTATEAGDLQLILYSDFSGAKTKREQLDIPALTQDTWTHAELTLASPSSDTAVDGVGIEAEADPGTMTIHVDDIEVVPYVTRIRVIVTSALKGWNIDLTPPYEIATGSHNELIERSEAEKTLVSITTENQDDSNKNVSITQCAWTVEFIGAHNADDYTLKGNEIAAITVWLVNYQWDSTNSIPYYDLGSGTASRFITDTNRVLGTNTTLKLELTPPAGATYPVERTTPATLTSVMYLRS